MRLAAQPRLTVLSAALSVGFGSGESFARAFKNRFGDSPTAWRIQQATHRRTKSNPGQADHKIGQVRTGELTEHDVSQTLQLERIMNVKLLNRKSVSVAYLRHVGPYGEPISRFWRNTYYPWAITNNLLNQARYGISYDDPSITEAEQCRYDACAEVEANFVVSGGALKTTIPGGKYAVLGFKGTAAQVNEAWSALLRDWLPSSGLQLDARPCFEYYPTDATYDPQTGAFECELCIPVVPLSSTPGSR
jgi:AraC family transcriptional regulator